MKELILENKQDSKKSYHALAGANLRKELKHLFPNTKFKVTTSSYSGGSSLTVRWTDGASGDIIQAIVNKYVYGHYNGMEDTYEYDKDSTDEYGDVKYGFTERSYSKEAFEEAVRYTGAEVEIKHYEYSGYSIHGDYNEEVIVYNYLKDRVYD